MESPRERGEGRGERKRPNCIKGPLYEMALPKHTPPAHQNRHAASNL